MGPLEHANNQELLSNLTGPSVAGVLMEQYGGLTGLASASFDELQAVKGIGQSKAAAIKSAFLLAQRLTVPHGRDIAARGTRRWLGR